MVVLGIGKFCCRVEPGHASSVPSFIALYFRLWAIVPIEAGENPHFFELGPEVVHQTDLSKPALVLKSPGFNHQQNLR